jgi:maleylacetate reductase
MRAVTPEAQSLRFRYTERPLRVVFGDGVIRESAGHLREAGLARALVVTTPGRARETEVLREVLGDELAGVHDGAVQHVPSHSVQAALSDLARYRASSLVALGGGSAIGLAKALALETGLPLAAIPTTYSGSEMTSIWGISDDGGKRTGRDDRVAPVLVLYDVGLTLDLPVDISVASGMNALAHCVEALYSADASPVSTSVAEEGVRRIGSGLLAVVQSPRDLEARSDMLAGAHLAGRALDMSSMGLHHKLCHVLGGSFGMPHAETHAALLPFVTAWNEASAPRAMERLAGALPSTGATSAADALLRLAQAAGVRPLADLGFRAADISRAAELCVAQAYSNPRAVTAAGVRSILEAALAGDLLLVRGSGGL